MYSILYRYTITVTDNKRTKFIQLKSPVRWEEAVTRYKNIPYIAAATYVDSSNHDASLVYAYRVPEVRSRLL